MSTLKVTNISPQSGNDVYLTGSLIVSNIVRAREVVTTISSSQILVSGSTNFGDSIDDTHTFTGSILITGSSTQSGTIDVTGAESKVRFLYANTGSLPSATDYHGMFAHVHAEGAAFFAHAGNWVELANSSSFSASIATLSASVGTRLTTEEANVDALQADSASFSSRITTAESELGNTLLSSSAQIASDISGSFVAASSSIAADIDALQLFSTSLDTTYATDAQLATATASLSSSLATDIATNTADIATLTSATSSYALGTDLSTLDGMVTALKAATGSYASTGSNTYTGNQIVSASVLLTLQQLTGSMPTGVATGSLIVSGSPVQLYIYNGSGSGWNRV